VSSTQLTGIAASGLEETSRAVRSSRSEAGVTSRRTSGLRVAFFFAFVLCCIWSIDFLIDRGIRRISTSEFGVLNRVVDGKINAEMLVLGSSRALCHYDAPEIERITGMKVFNLGKNASHIDMQLTFLKAYLKRNSAPRLMVLNLDSFSFEPTREVHNPGQYMPYLSENELYEGLRRINPNAWKWRHIPLYGYTVEDLRFTWINGIAAFFGVHPEEDLAQGYRPDFKEWSNEFTRFKAQHPNGVRWLCEDAGIQAMTEFLSTCRSNGIAVLMAYSPVYHEMQALERNRAEIFGKFYELGKAFGVPVWDFSESDICRKTELFHNSQHLNAKGARAFSVQLAERIKAEGRWTVLAAKSELGSTD
jgi:hypothetical protein